MHKLMLTYGGRFLNNISFVFDKFSDNLFTANHMHNLASSLFNISRISNILLPAQNIFVSCCGHLGNGLHFSGVPIDSHVVRKSIIYYSTYD